MKLMRSIFIRIGFILLLLVPAYIFQSVAQIDSIERLVFIIQSNLVLYFIGLFLLKTASIIYPPLPGVVVTMASVPVIGWQMAYAIDLAGSTLGSTIAYFLGKKYGFPLIETIIGATVKNRVAKIRLKKTSQIEASIMLRFATAGLLSDGLSWGASLIGFSFKPFIIGYIVSHILATLPIFLGIGLAVSFHSWSVLLFVMIVAWIFMYRFKGRYFE